MIEKYRAAFLRHDIPTLEKIWADDYVFVNAFGEVLTKAQRLANLRSDATTLESINEEEKYTVRVYQNSAVATNRVTLKGQYSGQPVSGQYRSTLVWIKGPNGWQLVANQLTPLAVKVPLHGGSGRSGAGNWLKVPARARARGMDRKRTGRRC
jgi:ketosteroid isomerase-like protein